MRHVWSQNKYRATFLVIFRPHVFFFLVVASDSGNSGQWKDSLFSLEADADAD
jgi:hypothetical protein